jgi:S-DNA-T family DNA segregation ATPase FtsK/SpoIIIE
VKNNAPLVNFRRLSIPFPFWLVVLLAVPVALWWLGRLLVRLVPVLVRNYRSLAVAVVAGWLWARYGWLALVLVVVAVAVLAAVWWWRARRSCERWLLFPLLAWFRRLVVYRLHWRHVMTVCKLGEKYDGGHIMPKLLRVRCTHAVDEVVLRMARGQNPDSYHQAAQDLAYAFNYRQCRVFSTRRTYAPARAGRLAWLVRLVDRVRFRDRPRLVWLVFIRRDPLTRIVPALPIPARPDFDALPLGIREDGIVYTLRLLANNLLIVGATRAGKGSVIWSLIRALAVAVRSGLAQLWVIDPKGGMELYMGRPLFTRYEDSDYTAMADLLDNAIAVMRDRQRRLRGIVRAHTPSLADPLIVIVIDELACLLAYLQDKDLRARITESLSLLLTQGAGLGVLVVGASQDPRKEVLTLRDLFTTRIALRLNESGAVDLVLGDGSRKRGALCDQIPNDPALRGIAYVVLDHQPEPARVRFGHVTDPDIKDMAATYQPEPQSDPVDDRPLRTPTPGTAEDPVLVRPRGRSRRPARGPLLPDRLAHMLTHQDPE